MHELSDGEMHEYWVSLLSRKGKPIPKYPHARVCLRMRFVPLGGSMEELGLLEEAAEAEAPAAQAEAEAPAGAELEQLEREREQEAIVKLQAVARGHLVRKQQQEEHNAAVRVQSLFRGRAARRKLHQQQQHQPQQASEVGGGTLFIHLECGRDLPNLDFGSESDPFVKFYGDQRVVEVESSVSTLRCGVAPLTAEQVIQDNNNPDWGEDLALRLGGLQHPLELKACVCCVLVLTATAHAVQTIRTATRTSSWAESVQPGAAVLLRAVAC